MSGLTDTTSLGGHGSDTVTRTRDSLAGDTAALGENAAENAVATREEAERERDQAQTLLLQHPDDAELHHRLADADEKLGDNLSAVREYQRADDLDPKEAYLFDWGAELLLHHAAEPAREVFAQGNRLFPRSERVLLGLGAAWFALGSVDEAVDKCREASNLAAHGVNPFLFVGKMEKAEKVPSPAAVEMLRRFVREFPDDADANDYYATALWRSREGSHDAALEAEVEAMLRRAMQANPHFAAAYLELGRVHADQHEYEKAIADYQRAVDISSSLEKLAPGSQLDTLAQAHFRLSRAYRQTRDRERAALELKAFEQFEQQSAQQADRVRREIPQFVYTLRDQPAP